MIMAYAAVCLGSYRENAAMVVEEACVDAFDNIGEFNSNNVRFGPWVRSYIRGKAIQKLRVLGAEPFIRDDTIASGVEDVFSALESGSAGKRWESRIATLWQCSAQLPAPLKKVFNEFYKSSGTIRKTAVALQTDEQTVRERLTKARGTVYASFMKKTRGGSTS